MTTKRSLGAKKDVTDTIKSTVSTVYDNSELHDNNENIPHNSNTATKSDRTAKSGRKSLKRTTTTNDRIMTDTDAPVTNKTNKSQSHSNKKHKVVQSDTDTHNTILKQLNTRTSLYTRIDNTDTPVGLSEQHTELRKQLCKTIIERGNTSTCIYGEYSSGKSLLLKSVLHSIYTEHCTHTADSTILCNDKFITIYLNGNLFTDDITALHEICTQIQQYTHRTDTIIQHDFYSYLAYFYDYLHETKHAIILVLDAFEQFCAGRSRQSLLYNICDLLAKKHIALSIVACTRKINVYSLLEKRVQSRINFIRIVVPNYVYSEIVEISKQKLYVSNNTVHNDTIDTFFSNRDTRTLLTQYVDSGRSLSWYFTLLQYHITQHSSTDTAFTAQSLQQSITQLTLDPYQLKLHDCTDIELQLLCAYYTLQHTIDPTHKINFIRIYKTYCNKLKTIQNDHGTVTIYDERTCMYQYSALIEKQLLHICSNKPLYHCTPYEIQFMQVEINFNLINFKMFLEDPVNAQSTYLVEWIKTCS